MPAMYILSYIYNCDQPKAKVILGLRFVDNKVEGRI